MATGEIHRSSRYVVSRAARGDAGPAVVVKSVREEESDAAAAGRLQREYELLAELNVPGVVRPIAFEPVAGRPALILEDAGAQNLKEWLHRRALSAAGFLEVAVQLAEALARLHARRIIHRDINPWNVVVDQHGRATLIDFEAATTVGGPDAEAGVPPRLDAELSYVAPEETGRMNRLVDRRADLYSLGAVFYEMLTGRAPFVSADPVELVHAHLARAPVPPLEIDPAMPGVLSDIVLMLLAKMPEARYQSARALWQDLRECQARLARTGAIAPFPLGRADRTDDLALPETLYQRETQRASLLAAWQRAAAGESGVVVLAGPAGIGKSALAAELHAAVTEQSGRFLTGKFDQQHGRAPYAPWADAFRGLITEILAGPAAEIAAWRQRIEHALGENARVMTELAPELERLIGVQPPVPAVGAAETERRLDLAFQALMRVLASREHPLVVFLDDLQWADAASLRLFEVLATAPDLHSLLVIAALRPDECGPEVGERLETVSRATSFQRLDLAPLAEEAVVDLCCHTLRCEPARAQPLASLLVRKTAGNPFFVRRMLRFLHQSGLLVFDAGSGAWRWDLGEIEKVDVAENVVDLLLVVLKRLPEPVQTMLETVASIGHTAPLTLIAAVCGQDLDQVRRTIGTAVGAGLLAPVALAGQSEPAFRFVHDRIHQAAYLLLGNEERKRLHLRVGRELLRAAGDEHALDEQIYAVVDQIDRGLDLVSDAAERMCLSQLNLRAARKARGSSAYGPALEYLKCAIALLPDDAWQSHHRDAFVLHREGLEFAGLTGETALARELFERALVHAETLVEKAELYNTRMAVAIAQAERLEAFKWGVEGIRLFGIEIPSEDPETAAQQQIDAISATLAHRTPADLLEAPRMQSPEHLACIELLSTLLDASYFHRPDLFPFLAARAVSFTLEHGNAPPSANAYISYAVMLAGRTGDYQTGHAFGRLALDLVARFDDPVRQTRIAAIFTSSVNNWTAPLETTLPVGESGQSRALQAGDTYFAGAFSLTNVMVRMHQGTELAQLVTHVRAAVALWRSVRAQRSVEEHLVFLHAIRTLQGSSLQENDLDLAGTTLDEHGIPPRLTEESGKLPEYQIVHLGVACVLRDLDRALELVRAIGQSLNRVPRFIQHVEWNFYSSVVLAARATRASGDEAQALRATITANQQQLGVWAKNNRESFGHKHLIVAAELARLEGRGAEAAELYDQAITAAGRGRFVNDEGLANELCGRFYLAQGRRRIAGLYLSAAIDAYARWGAKAKVDALEAEFAELAATTDRIRTPGERGPTHDRTGGAALDLMALFRAAEAVSSEVMLPAMLGKLMEVCLATAGAERGAFVVEEDGELFVRAVGAINRATEVQKTPLGASVHLPARVVEHVRRSGEALVVADAIAHEELAAEPYIAAHAVRSLLALPIVRQTKFMGVLYLENNLATRAFTPERVRLLTTLSSQIATSLQNSLLFAQLSAEVEERKRAEAAVRFLADAGAALAESLEYQSTLRKLAQLTVPALADWCVVHVIDEGKVDWVASAHVDPEKQRLLEEHLRGAIGRPLPAHVTEVLESGKPVLYDKVDRTVVERYVSGPDAWAMVAAIGAESSMILPLRAHGRFLGAMTLASNLPDRRFGKPDLAAAEELARRAALAIDNVRLYRQATEAIRLRDEFLSIASHELNTPVAALKLVAQAFEGEEAAPPAPVFGRMMSIVARQSQRLAMLVGDLLDVAQIPAGTLTLHRESVELVPLVRETVDFLRANLEQAKCELALRTEAAPVGAWDRARVQQVLAKLLSNAIKFAPGTEIELTVTTASSGVARVIVEDHGQGISPERLPHVFGRFERGVSASNYGGLGLGLYIVRAIVEAHGGTVSVTSAPGAGARFTVDLPLGEGAARS